MMRRAKENPELAATSNPGSYPKFKHVQNSRQGLPPQAPRNRRRSRRIPPSRFHRSRLPDPASYYEKHLPEVRNKGKGWVSVRCPFHEDTSPSLAVNLAHGGFRCFGCGARGGDILDFHRLLKSLSFKEAADALGAWS